MARTRQTSRRVKLVRLPARLARPDLERRLPRNTTDFRDLTGRKFDRCTVVGLAGVLGQVAAWLCRCKCGTLFVTRANSLGHRPTGCGCGRATQRGRSGTPEYVAWHEMRREHAGEICRKWQRFSQFLEDVGPRPGIGYVLGRVDSCRPYSPGNVKWWTKRDFNRHVRGILIRHGSQTLCIADWARRVGISHQGMHHRIAKCQLYGGSLAEALTTPVGASMPCTRKRRGLRKKRRSSRVG
jgi:hypothetical protein